MTRETVLCAAMILSVAAWSKVPVTIVGALAPSATKSWSFRIRAPLASGSSYRLQREMFDSRPGGVGLFRTRDFCVDVPIDVSGTNVLGASLASGARGTLSSVVMTPANQTGCGAFDGLASDAGAAALDGNAGGCWWFAVGSNGSFGGGIPAYDSSAGGGLVTDRVRLYVRR